ncbi:hypothetical protein [Saccharospirillum mangrovi]|uniref:hypothetical protein n=1 Tax=Saccharospirillum mangrovi TaxID=2161747 RepID=UPI0013003E43|nr:hypothetical protein [Saccharospirillum mangrovi]
MNQYNVIWVRAKRYFKQWIRDAISQTTAPLWDNNARLNYVGFLVAIFLLFPQWSADARVSWAGTTINGLTTIIYSIPLFFLANLVFSIFRIRKNEKMIGAWFGNRFIYHEPLRLLTVLVDENDNENPFVFAINDAEDDSLVSYVIKTDRIDNRAKVEIAWARGFRPMDCGKPMNIPKCSIRLPKGRKMSLITNVEPNSTVTTVRVFMTGWEVGKGGGRR